MVTYDFLGTLPLDVMRRREENIFCPTNWCHTFNFLCHVFALSLPILSATGTRDPNGSRINSTQFSPAIEVRVFDV